MNNEQMNARALVSDRCFAFTTVRTSGTNSKHSISQIQEVEALLMEMWSGYPEKSRPSYMGDFPQNHITGGLRILREFNKEKTGRVW